MLHVCCNAYRKRAYTAQYQDLAAAFRVARLDQVCLEHCTLSYDMITLWYTWDFTGEFAVGVIDQRSDGIESDEEIARRAGRFSAGTPPSYLGVWFSARSARCHPDEAARAGSRGTILAGVAIQPGPGLATRALAERLELYC